MSVTVMYKNDIVDQVEPFLLDSLISSNKIKRFLRSEGWADVASDPIRGKGGGTYTGPERRSTTAAILPESAERAPDKKTEERHPGYAIVEALPTPIAVLNIDLTILLANHRFYEFFGLIPRETLGRSVFEICERQLDFRDLRESLQNILARKARDAQFEIDFAFPESRSKTVLLTASSVYPDVGEINMLLLVFEDITDRNTNQRQLIDVQEHYRELVAAIREMTGGKKATDIISSYSKELEQSNKEFDQFASILVHDLQSPLRVITTFAERLTERYRKNLDENGKKYISLISDATQSMREMIRDLHEYSRIITRKKPFGRVDCNSVLEKALNNMMPQIRESGALVTSGVLPEISGDTAQLAQLFHHLVRNAIVFRNRNKLLRVHVSAERKEDYWLFRVADNGIGIDAKHFERIFEIFQRLHTREEYPGSGIGLAICKKIVERHGGSIWVDSNPGAGSTFYFTLPAVDY